MLCVATIALWVRSHRTADQLFLGRHLLASEFGALYWSPGVALLRRYVSRRRFARGICDQCGHDLRASPGRCPECGMQNDAAVASP